MTHADAELVEWLRGQIDIWEQSDAGSPECAQAYLQISAKGLSTARLLLAQSAESARLRDALGPFAKWAGAFDQHYHGDEKRLQGCHATVGDLRRARAALETKG